MPTIRMAEDRDIESLLAIYNDAVLNTTAVYDETPRDLAGQHTWLAAKREQDWPVLVAEDSGQAVGYASFGPFRPWPGYRFSVENSVYVALERRGQGIGRRLMERLLEEAAARRFRTMIAGIDADNSASIKLHLGLGFSQVAHFHEVGTKFGRWLDLLFLQKML